MLKIIIAGTNGFEKRDLAIEVYEKATFLQLVLYPSSHQHEMMKLGIIGCQSFPKQWLGQGRGQGAVVLCSQRHYFLFPSNEVYIFFF